MGLLRRTLFLPINFVIVVTLLQGLPGFSTSQEGGWEGGGEGDRNAGQGGKGEGLPPDQASRSAQAAPFFELNF